MDNLEMHFDDNGDIETNYFETEWNAAGKFFLAIGKKNTFHLFVPDSIKYTVHEMLTGKYAIMTTGITDVNKARIMGVSVPDKKNMFEILFEDETDNPFCVHLDENSCPYNPNETFNRKIAKLVVWTSDDYYEMDMYMRIGKSTVLPYMKPVDIKTFTRI